LARHQAQQKLEAREGEQKRERQTKGQSQNGLREFTHATKDRH
jgi:hypothetical protein